MNLKNATLLLLTAALATACTTTKPSPDVDLTEGTNTTTDPKVEVEPEVEAPPAPTAADVLTAVCAPEDIDGDTCRVCPPDAPDPDMEGPLRVANMKAGAFSAPGADEVLVTFEGCAGPPIESESLLMKRTEGGFEVVARNTLVHVVTCSFPRAADGTLLIACMDLDGNQGYNYTNLRQFKPDAKLTPVELFELVSDVAACPMGGAEYSNEEGRSLDVGDVDGDGLDDLTVTFDSARGTVPAEFVDYCEAEEKGHAFPKTTAKTQVFIQKDGGFVAK